MRPVVFLDTETTSLADGRLVQICVKGPQPDELLFYAVKPPVPIGLEAMAVHHITEKMVADKAPFEGRLRDQAADPLTKNVVVAHNAPFDVAVMAREGIEIKEWICTKKVAMRLWPEWGSHGLQYIRYRLGIDIDAGNAHDALADVLVLEQVFHKMLGEATIDQMLDWSVQPSIIHFAAFGKHRGKPWKQVAAEDPQYLFWLRRQDIDADLLHTLNHWIGLASRA